MLSLGDVVVRHVDDTDDEQNQTDYKGDETVLILRYFTHLPVL